MTLDEAINRTGRMVEDLKAEAEYDKRRGFSEEEQKCNEYAKEHLQLASWLKELKERREADRWINVKERLPDKEKKYLVQTESDIVTLAFFEGDYFEHLYGGKICAKYWRPLPELYKESEGE